MPAASNGLRPRDGSISAEPVWAVKHAAFSIYFLSHHRAYDTDIHMTSSVLEQVHWPPADLQWQCKWQALYFHSNCGSQCSIDEKALTPQADLKPIDHGFPNLAQVKSIRQKPMQKRREWENPSSAPELQESAVGLAPVIITPSPSAQQ